MQILCSDFKHNFCHLGVCVSCLSYPNTPNSFSSIIDSPTYKQASKLQALDHPPHFNSPYSQAIVLIVHYSQVNRLVQMDYGAISQYFMVLFNSWDVQRASYKFGTFFMTMCGEIICQLSDSALCLTFSSNCVFLQNGEQCKMCIKPW